MLSMEDMLLCGNDLIVPKWESNQHKAWNFFERNLENTVELPLLEQRVIWFSGWEILNADVTQQNESPGRRKQDS